MGTYFTSTPPLPFAFEEVERLKNNIHEKIYVGIPIMRKTDATQ